MFPAPPIQLAVLDENGVRRRRIENAPKPAFTAESTKKEAPALSSLLHSLYFPPPHLHDSILYEFFCRGEGEDKVAEAKQIWPARVHRLISFYQNPAEQLVRAREQEILKRFQIDFEAPERLPVQFFMQSTVVRHAGLRAAGVAFAALDEEEREHWRREHAKARARYFRKVREAMALHPQSAQLKLELWRCRRTLEAYRVAGDSDGVRHVVHDFTLRRGSLRFPRQENDMEYFLQHVKPMLEERVKFFERQYAVPSWVVLDASSSARPALKWQSRKRQRTAQRIRNQDEQHHECDF